MTTANPRAMVMPLRPPKYWPISINKSVRATSKNVVRKILIISFYSTRALFAHRMLLLIVEELLCHTSPL